MLCVFGPNFRSKVDTYVCETPDFKMVQFVLLLLVKVHNYILAKICINGEKKTLLGSLREREKLRF